MVDLGAWFNGERSIAGEPADPVDAVNPAGTSTTNDNTQR
jgi:endogenous inhibitor of DNA gyrase (YacG/DUF329 family)